MLDVYVCEDNLKQLELITDLIKKSILIEELDMQVALSTKDPYEVLKALDTAAHTGLFFLDIDLKHLLFFLHSLLLFHKKSILHF